MASVSVVPEEEEVLQAVTGVDIDERLEQLRNTESGYLRRLGRMTAPEEREYLRIVREIRRLNNLKIRQNRPSFRERVSSFLMRRRTAPIAPVSEEVQVAQFME